MNQIINKKYIIMKYKTMNRSIALLLCLVVLNWASAFSQSTQTKSDIKNHFRNGYAPGSSHFGYLIDACYNYSVSEGLIYDPVNNTLKAEVPLVLLKKYLQDSIAAVRGENLLIKSDLQTQLKEAADISKSELNKLDSKLISNILETESGIKILLSQTVETLNADIKELEKELQTSNASQDRRLLDSLSQVRAVIQIKTNEINNSIGVLESALNKKLLENELHSTRSLIDTAKTLRNYSTQKHEMLQAALLDSTKNIRIDLIDKAQVLTQLLNEYKLNLEKQLHALDNNKTSQLADTARVIHAKVDRLNQAGNEKLSSEILRLEGVISNLNKHMEQSDGEIRIDYNNKLNVMQVALSDSSNNIRNDFINLNQQTNSDFNKQLFSLKGMINETNSALEDSCKYIRTDFSTKLQKLEETLQDTAMVIRKSLHEFNETLSLKILNGDADLKRYINDAKNGLIGKIDSLADVHNVDRLRHEERMTAIEKNHTVLNDTVVKMKNKLDTLNYTENNFSQTLKLKLENVEDGATRSDNNFTDELKTKLDGIEHNANNYKLPLGTHSKLGGIMLSQDFVIYNGRAYNALDPNKIDREYAKDTITKNWTGEMKDGDQWTRIRYKMENGEVDAEGNKLYDFG
jgi:hypothetical protein